MRRATTTFIALFMVRVLSAQYQPQAFPADTIFTHADQMPYFSGCEAFDQDTVGKRQCSDSELARFLSQYLQYPDPARYQGIEGTVFVSFIIDRDGWVTGPRILMDIGGGCGNAALDVIRDMPRWEPAVHKGNPVNVRMNLPIQFFLRSSGRDHAEKYSLSWGRIRGDMVSKDDLEESRYDALYVRGPEGGNRYIDELTFIYEHDDRTVSATSHGRINDALLKVVDRVKRDGTFTIRASIQEKGEFITISRSFEVIR